MTTYLRMWAKVKALTPEERQRWIQHTKPCIGKIFHFYGIKVLDFDLYEALIEMEGK